jgi:capsular exopolysaccharide synthesis family protein
MKKELIAFNEPKSPITENFKALRTNLQFMKAGKNIKVILITSTLPGEGKSWTTANLAITFAQAGNKVIILDADMRKGRQFSLFNIPPRPGLSNYLSGVINSKKNIDMDNVMNFVKETDIENLYVLPSGDVPPNPSELLITQRMINLIEDLKNMCDVIIIDTPPATLVTDAKILSRLADVSLIVATHKGTKMDNLKKAKKEIENVGGRVGGVILNKVPVSAKKYEGGYYYGETSLIKPNNKLQDMFIRSKSTLLEDRQNQGRTEKKESRPSIKSIISEEYNKHKNESKQEKNNSFKNESKKEEINLHKNENKQEENNSYKSESKQEEINPYKAESKQEEINPYKAESKQEEINPYKAESKQEEINPYKVENNQEEINPYKIENETRFGNNIKTENSEENLNKTQDILRQINNYLDEERRKMNSGE